MATALQHHGQQPQKPHTVQQQGFTFLLICDHDAPVFNAYFTVGGHFYSKAWGALSFKPRDTFLAIHKEMFFHWWYTVHIMKHS